MTSGALLLVLLSGAIHAAWNVAAKQSRDPQIFLLILLVTGTGLLLPVWFFFDPGEIAGTTWGIMALSGCVHCFYALALARAYRDGDLSLVYPIARSTPAFVPFVAVPLLGEKLAPVAIVGIALVVASFWLLQVGGKHVAWQRFRQPGTAWAFATLAVTVVYTVLDTAVMRQLGDAPWTGAAPRALVFFEVQALIDLALFAFIIRRKIRPRVLHAELRLWRGHLLAGAGSIASYGLILEALRHSPSSYVVAVRQASVLFALAFGIRRLGERPSGWQLTGVVGTVAGVVLVALA